MRRACLAIAVSFVALVFQGAASAQKFSYPSFSDSSVISLDGTASIVDGVLRLVPEVSYSTGNAWYPQKVKVASGFTTSFQFRITHSAVPADGVWFYIQKDLGPFVVENFVAVELDTYRNPEFDPNSNHIGIYSCGPGKWNTIVWSDLFQGCTLSLSPSIGASLSDGLTHTVSISYSPGSMVVALDGRVISAAAVNLVSLIASTDGTAAVGINAFNGLYFEQVDILSWSFKSSR